MTHLRHASTGPGRSRTNELLFLSGVTEVAVGALTGWPFAIALSDQEKANRLGIRSLPRMRQWHLDLISLGALSALVGAAVPNLPRHVAWPLAVGGWTNAHAFGVLAFRPEADQTRAYQVAELASFTTVSWGWLSLIVFVVRRISRGAR